jgi:hypothetical protein
VVTTVHRLEGWESRLNAVIEGARDKPYVLGSWDCFRLACNVLEALTGVDRWPEWRGRYATKEQALRLLASRASSFEDAGDGFFGVPHVATAFARRGDIVALATGDGAKHLGVCLGSRAACLSESGLVFVPVAKCLCVWRIG